MTIDLPNFNDLFRVGRDEVAARQAKLSQDAIEREGTDANALVAAMAAMADEVIGQVAEVARATFLDTATGDALDRFVFDRYGLVRKQAAPALCDISFSTVIAAPAAFSIPADTELSTADGVQFITTSAVTYPKLGVGPVKAQARSVLAGLDYAAKIGSITSILSSIAGAPSDLAATNAAATVGQADAEADSSLRERARSFWQAARRGTADAIEQSALAVGGVETAQLFEVVSPRDGLPDYAAELVIADTFTETIAALDQTPPAYEAQAATLETTVFNAITNDDARPAGIPIRVRVAQVNIQPISVAPAFAAGADTVAVALEARATLVAYTNALKPGEGWRRQDALTKLAQISGLAYTGNEIVSPAGDVVPTSLQVIRTLLALVTTTTC